MVKWTFFFLLIVNQNLWAQSQLTHEGRIRNFSGSTNEKLNFDIQDRDIYSPKSVHFSLDGKKLYVNSLEGGKTVVYSYPDLQKLKVISHTQLVTKEPVPVAHVFAQKQVDKYKEEFWGKPVEMTLTRDGRYLWIPYYRRNFDMFAQGPAAVAIVDTKTDKIVRVLPTGPIPKFVALSPDGKTAAVTNWGDNTITLFDTSSLDPAQYKQTDTLTVGTKLDQNNLDGTDRDSTCGFCLRGTVFTPDSQYLLVGRMKGGGIAGFRLQDKKYLGVLGGLPPTPRHLLITPDKEELIVSSNSSGAISKARIDDVINALETGVRVPWEIADIGSGARTVDASSDGRYLFVAMNVDQKIIMVETQTLNVLSEALVDPYPVGLAVSPIDEVVVVTSQGRNGRGGNAVNFYRYASPNELRMP